MVGKRIEEKIFKKPMENKMAGGHKKNKEMNKLKVWKEEDKR